MSQRNSDTLGLSEADFAALATARQSDEWPTIYQTSTSPTIDYGSRRKDDGKAPIEPKSKSSSSSGAISASEYYSNVTTASPSHQKFTTLSGQQNTASPPPLGESYLKSGFPEFKSLPYVEMTEHNHSSWTKQVGGSHYKDFVIQPAQFIHKNGIGFLEGNVIKYVCRYKSKNGIEDLKKARHYIDLLIDAETP